MARVPINHRILISECREIEFSGDPAINLSDDTVFQFLNEEFEGTSPLSSMDDNKEEEEEEEDSEEQIGNGDRNRSSEDDNFWETQHQLLQSTIRRTSSLESRIRSITKETIKEAETSGKLCACGRPLDNSCRKCLMEEVRMHLQNAGFDSAICKSKWRSSPEIPSGEHIFVDVIDTSNPKKGQVRVIIELNFRAQFEMARANDEYNKLIKKLPEIFVGKIERLLEVLKIVCGAGKKCMKQKKMHMAPWRKHRYMQAKWLRTCDRASSFKPGLGSGSGRATRPTISMLTADLRRPVVEVV